MICLSIALIWCCCILKGYNPVGDLWWLMFFGMFYDMCSGICGGNIRMKLG